MPCAVTTKFGIGSSSRFFFYNTTDRQNHRRHRSTYGLNSVGSIFCVDLLYNKLHMHKHMYIQWRSSRKQQRRREYECNIIENVAIWWVDDSVQGVHEWGRVSNAAYILLQLV